VLLEARSPWIGSSPITPATNTRGRRVQCRSLPTTARWRECAARLLKVHGKSLVNFYIEPGSSVTDRTAAKLIEHPQVYSEHDGLLPDCDQSWMWRDATPIKFLMHNKCRCGSNCATSIGDGYLHCADCKADRGKLSDLTTNFVNATAAVFGGVDHVRLKRRTE
jgi:hypothetical protein